jgi:hypothetical protein
MEHSSSTPTLTTLAVPPRFAGPPSSANGGYLAGRLAAHVPTHGAVQVTLRVPPPLDTPMTVERDGDGVRLTTGDRLVAEAAPAALDVDVVEPVAFATAREAATRYGGLEDHPFPHCFVCGPAREPGDGMRLFPGRLDDRADTVAAAWVPDASLGTDHGEAGADGSAGEGLTPAAGGDAAEAAEEFVWAALDCPGGWAVDLTGRPMVLGRMTCQVDEIPRVGEQCVVMGRVLGQEGRKTFTTTTAYDTDGRVLGRAHAVWIAVDPATLGDL